MSEEQKRILEQQLWNIANTLRGKMDANEYLIGMFASGAGKKAGEFYTQQQASKILAKIVTTEKIKLKTVYDPACGSGSLLLRVSREAEVAFKAF